MADRRFARPEDAPLDYDRDLGDPGSFPFTRGIHRDMYAGRPWSIRQYAGYGTAEETNRRFRFLIERGQAALSTAFDLPTQMGLDSDDPLAEGEVGRVGVAIDSIGDMEVMFAGIPLDEVSTSMTINAPAPVLVAMYRVACARQGRDPAAIRGTAQNDVLKEYVSRGTYIYPPRPSLRLAADMIAWCAREAPRFNAISLSGYHMREAGCTAAQEMGFAIANAVAYVTAATERGVGVDEFAPRLSWIFNTHMDFFEEIAKYRALRRMWAHVMRDRFGAADPRSMMLRTHTQTAGSALTLQQPENNIVRAAVQALAAALGGVQSMALSCFDEAIAIPTEHAQTLAVRTQQMLQHEFGVTDVADPLGGSWYVEKLTFELEAEATRLVEHIDELGGAVAAIEAGVYQRMIADEAYERERRIASGEDVVVGVNRYADEAAPPPARFDVPPALAADQRARLEALRADRDGAAAETALAGLRDAAAGDGNLMPAIVAAVEAEASLGEICSAMRDVFGAYRPAAAAQI
ncbi:MAG TPA: methylmalonyl-CoA mutase family protein [Gaiellales bacterium]|jgi:methylmalonyl-CoA mutase N-terminal domain/subunit|nr:methylmalonyl-CoA mutase family protein [Gaiellales bacterium]